MLVMLLKFQWTCLRSAKCCNPSSGFNVNTWQLSGRQDLRFVVLPWLESSKTYIPTKEMWHLPSNWIISQEVGVNTKKCLKPPPGKTLDKLWTHHFNDVGMSTYILCIYHLQYQLNVRWNDAMLMDLNPVIKKQQHHTMAMNKTPTFKRKYINSIHLQ